MGYHKLQSYVFLYEWDIPWQGYYLILKRVTVRNPIIFFENIIFAAQNTVALMKKIQYIKILLKKIRNALPFLCLFIYCNAL